MSAVPVILTFNGESLYVTIHAIERLKERWRIYNKVQLMSAEVVPILSELLEKAKPDNLKSAHRVNRIFNNNFKIAEYWAHAGWRFVMVKENHALTLVTVERAHRHTRHRVGLRKIVRKRREYSQT